MNGLGFDESKEEMLEGGGSAVRLQVGFEESLLDAPVVVVDVELKLLLGELELGVSTGLID